MSEYQPIVTVIVGTHHRGPEALARLERLAVGETVALVREPTNPHDPNAVAVYSTDGVHLGYVPRTAHAQVLPRFTADATRLLCAAITHEAVLQYGRVRFAPKIKLAALVLLLLAAVPALAAEQSPGRPYSCRLLDDEEKKCAFMQPRDCAPGTSQGRVVERLDRECRRDGGRP